MIETTDNEKAKRYNRWDEVIKCHHPWCIMDAMNLADAEQEFIHKQIEFVKSLHVKMLYGDKSGYGCEGCRDNWPCETITELTKEEK